MDQTLLHIIKNSKILYIEDEQAIQEQMVKSLNYFCENIICASNYDEAMELYENEEPSIIISDIQLTDKSGIDLVQEIRKNNKKIPIILLTAYTKQEYLLEAIKLKLVNYLRKPINSTELIDSLKDAAREILDEGGFTIHFKDGITYDVLKNIVIKDDKQITLTAKETKLLEILIKNRSRRSTTEEIKQYMWSDGEASDGSLKTILNKLRKKIGKESINNLSNIGYILVAQ